MARRKSLRSQLYRAARDLGNVQAPAKAQPATASGSCDGRCTGPLMESTDGC